MIYYRDEDVMIRSMVQEDSQTIYNELELRTGIHPKKSMMDTIWIKSPVKDMSLLRNTRGT